MTNKKEMNFGLREIRATAHQNTKGSIITTPLKTYIDKNGNIVTEYSIKAR